MLARRYLQYFPDHCDSHPSSSPAAEPAKDPAELAQIIPTNQNAPFDMFEMIERIVDANSFLEIKALFARELITGLGAHRRACSRNRCQPAKGQRRGVVRRLGG